MPKRMLVSVKDPTGIEQFLKLVDRGWEVLSISDTAYNLHGRRIPFIEVEDIMGYNLVKGGEVDMVVVNLSPFSGSCVSLIDLIGPLLLRAAVVNGNRVSAVSSPDQYEKVIQEVIVHEEVSETTREDLAMEVFALTSLYEQSVLNGMRATRTADRHFLL